MKKLSVVVLSLLAASAAMAQGLTREQVVAELVRARNAGELTAMNSENFGLLDRATPGNSRTAPVLAEAQRSRAQAKPAGEAVKTKNPQ